MAARTIMNAQTSSLVFGGHMCYLISLIAVGGFVMAAVNGARFEQKSHGLRTELAAHSVCNPFTVDSRTMCASACQTNPQTCDLIFYSATNNSCTIYNAYMSDDQPALEGLYGKTGAIDKKPCQVVLYSPTRGRVSYSGTSYGTTAYYTCDMGYKTGSGPSSRTCGANGQWSGYTPSCVSTWAITHSIWVTNEGPYGSWGSKEYCPSGSYAYSYDLKIEPPHAWDDSELNAVKLYCKTLDGSYYGSITSTVGPFGNWLGPKDCGYMQFLTGFAMQVESIQGSGDDTTANFVKVKCRDFPGTYSSYETYISPGQGRWGSYGYWSSECGAYSAVCGIQTKVEARQGDGDDTALNDVILFCCS